MARYQEDNGYISMLDPNIFQFQQQLLNRKQGQYDAGYSIALDTKDKYSTFDSDPEDVQVRNQALDQFTGNINDLVQTKYNGDWGRASKEVAGLVTKFKQDPVWETMQYAKQQRAMEDELTARFGPSALPFASMRGKSVLGADGKLLTPEQMRVNVEERLNDLPVMDKIWSELSPRTWSGTSFTTKELPNGQVINVMVDSKGKEISEDMINKELNNMLNIYRDTDNYKQRIREYTQIGGMDVAKMDVAEAEEKIKQDFLEVGMSKKMRQSDQNVQPYNPSNYVDGDEPTSPQEAMTFYKKDTEKLPGTEDVDKSLRKGLKGKEIPQTPGGGFANTILEQAKSEIPLPDYNNVIKNRILEKRNVNISDSTINEALDIYEKNPPSVYNIEESKSHKEIVNLLQKKFPKLNVFEIQNLYKDIVNTKTSLDKPYNQAIKVKAEEIKSKNYGPVDVVYTTPDLNTKVGQKLQTYLDDINKYQINAENIQFIKGDLSGEKYNEKQREKVREAYASSKNNKSPKIKAVAYDPNIGPRFLVETPDGGEEPAILTGGDPRYVINLLNNFGHPEAVNMMLNEYEVKNDQPVYSNSPFKIRMEGEGTNLWNYLYEGTRDNPKFLTVGRMRKLEEELGMDLGIDSNSKDSDRYKFDDKAEAILFSSWYQNKD